MEGSCVCAPNFMFPDRSGRFSAFLYAMFIIIQEWATQMEPWDVQVASVSSSEMACFLKVRLSPEFLLSKSWVACLS